MGSTEHCPGSQERNNSKSSRPEAYLEVAPSAFERYPGSSKTWILTRVNSDAVHVLLHAAKSDPLLGAAARVTFRARVLERVTREAASFVQHSRQRVRAGFK